MIPFKPFTENKENEEYSALCIFSTGILLSLTQLHFHVSFKNDVTSIFCYFPSVNLIILLFHINEIINCNQNHSKYLQGLEYFRCNAKMLM